MSIESSLIFVLTLVSITLLFLFLKKSTTRYSPLKTHRRVTSLLLFFFMLITIYSTQKSILNFEILFFCAAFFLIVFKEVGDVK